MNTQDVKRAITTAQRILVTSHVDPDGDAVGSELALASLAKELGKDVDIVNQDPIPGVYEFLPGAGAVLRPEQQETTKAAGPMQQVKNVEQSFHLRVPQHSET